MIREAVISSPDRPKRAKRIGMASDESMEPREIKSKSATVKTKSRTATRQDRGEMARKIPRAAATPFPPRNPLKREN